jgi:single-strand DNA-binding protein
MGLRVDHKLYATLTAVWTKSGLPRGDVVRRTGNWRKERTLSLNKVMLIGRLGTDPELRFTQGGAAVANFRVATNERWTDRDGQAQERTEWHRVVVWGRQAENCEKYLSKGRQVFIEGSLQTREWEDRDGNQRYTTEVKALNVVFLQGGDRNSDRGGDRNSDRGDRGGDRNSDRGDKGGDRNSDRGDKGGDRNSDRGDKGGAPRSGAQPREPAAKSGSKESFDQSFNDDDIPF